VSAVARQPGRKTRSQKIAEALAELDTPTPPMKFLIMMTGEFPQMERGEKIGDPDPRGELQHAIISAIEEAIKPFEERGVRLESFRMRVEKAEDFPI